MTDSAHARAKAAPSARTRVRRVNERARYDREAIDAVLDAGLLAHLGFVDDGQPFVIPTLHARIDDQLYVHGSSASRALRRLGEGIPACVTVTLVDGIVLARSVFEHSMNYRSVVVLGQATVVEMPARRTTRSRLSPRSCSRGAGLTPACRRPRSSRQRASFAYHSTRRPRRSGREAPRTATLPTRSSTSGRGTSPSSLPPSTLSPTRRCARGSSYPGTRGCSGARVSRTRAEDS